MFPPAMGTYKNRMLQALANEQIRQEECLDLLDLLAAKYAELSLAREQIKAFEGYVKRFMINVIIVGCPDQIFMPTVE